jgi:hypothetical protein
LRLGRNNERIDKSVITSHEAGVWRESSQIAHDLDCLRVERVAAILTDQNQTIQQGSARAQVRLRKGKKGLLDKARRKTCHETVRYLPTPDSASRGARLQHTRSIGHG